MFYLFYVYLRVALFLGFHRHVYRLTTKWGGASGQPCRNRAAWQTLNALFKKGYHGCPSCYWATERPNEHLEDHNSWCYEQSLPKCSCCGLPECDCQAASEADIQAYFEEQRRQAHEAERLFREQEEAEYRREQEALERFYRQEEEKDCCSTCGEHFSGCTCVSDALAEYKARQWPEPSRWEMEEISRHLFG